MTHRTGSFQDLRLRKRSETDSEESQHGSFHVRPESGSSGSSSRSLGFQKPLYPPVLPRHRSGDPMSTGNPKPTTPE